MRIPSNRLKAVLRFAKSELAEIYDDREIQSFFYILCDHYLGMNKTAVIVDPDFPLSESEMLKFNFAIKDLKTEKPIQYILGNTEFCGYEFKVNQHTLIPRPETEELVEWIVKSEKQEENLHILDIGTGSGCIAISLAKKLPKAKLVGVDISLEALKIAQSNNETLEAGVTFKMLDILNPKEEIEFEYDIIVSNPPYVLESERALMKKNVLEFEPDTALFVKDNDPLLFYQKIIDYSQNHLISGGSLYFEINEQLGTNLSALLEGNHFHSIELRKDLFERYRMLKAIKK